jgi:DNA polymerase III epsilon subunit-like protein
MIVVDVETTGINPRKHSILSIGAVDYDNPTNSFYGECRAWEGAHIMEESIGIHGFDEKRIWSSKEKPMEELMAEFLNWSKTVGSKILAGHNVCFDKSFLQMSADMADLNWFFAERCIDTHTLAYMHMQQRGEIEPLKKGHSMIGLSRIIEYCGLPARTGFHNALEDAELEAEVISRLVEGVPLLDKYKDFSIPF